MGQIKAAESKKTPTVAVDLDGTLAKMYDEFDPDSIEPPRAGAKKALQEFQRRGWRIIIHTVRGNDKLVKDWLHENDIPWDYINENPDQPKDASDKPIADLYIDDRGVDARRAWSTVTTEAITRIEKQGELAAWQQVSELVSVRYKEAANIQRSISRVAEHLPVADPGYGYIYWNPDTKTAWAVLSDSDEEATHQKWHNALKAIPGVQKVRTESEYGPHGDEDWIRIKTASALSWLNAPYQAAGNLTGGPSPLTNAIVSGLIGSGLGYGAGTLAEWLMPEEYVERGKLRRNLALLGGLGGAGLHAPEAVTNHRISATAGKPLGLSALWNPSAQTPMSPHELVRRNNFYGIEKQNAWDRMRSVAAQLPEPPALFVRSSKGFVKEAFGPGDPGSGVFGTGNVPLKPVVVDTFNRAIWNDVHNGVRSSQSNPFGTRSPYGSNMDTPHTPPHIGAAATGLVSGVQQMYGGAPVLSPTHFVSGLANAGLDLATAKVAGGILGALGGLTPAGQKKIQDMGIWGGFIRGVTGSVLGLR